jgi:hypothetical protein
MYWAAVMSIGHPYLLFPMICMGTFIAEWAMQCFPWVTIETIKEVVNLLNKCSCLQQAPERTLRRKLVGFLT